MSHNQREIDSIYSDIISIFQTEIDKLPNVPTAQSKKDQKLLRKSAPFWNDELNCLWMERCQIENLYLCYKCEGRNNVQIAEKRSLLNQFKDKQRQFNKAFRQAKRQYENNSFKNLADLAEQASNDLESLCVLLEII